MISGAHARRLLVVGLIGAGWLSILGNSPGPDYHLRMVARSGNLTIVPGNIQYTNACRLQASVSTPVRRFASFNGTELIAEISCADGSDCLRALPDFDLPPCGAVAGVADAGADAGNYAGGIDGTGMGTYGCPGPSGSPIQVNVTRGPRSHDFSFCNSETATYRLEVETAAGAKSTLDYKLQIEEPPGYFGCS
jgi:hypothetical protein